MNDYPRGVIEAVLPGSLGEALDLRPGDALYAINGHPLRDVLDVQFYAAEETLEIKVERDDEIWLLETKRDYNQPLGLDFVEPTFNSMRLCHNNCEFCFVAQMPPRKQGLRRSLYLRDDDYRYSVLYGSFITLTNLTDEDWQRLEEQRLSPLYISVQATEPKLRQRLLGKTDIPDLLPLLDRLAALGIEMHTQLVLVPGLNDGVHLAQSLNDLWQRAPAVCSVGIVPVGLTRYHRGGFRPYIPQEARQVLAQVEPRQTEWRAQLGSTWAYLSDEWYLMADKPIPSDALYDDYAQIENGIGLTRQLLDDAEFLLALPPPALTVDHCTLVCGTLIAPLLNRLADRLGAWCGTRFEVLPVQNALFGKTVTVSGLLGGQDVIQAAQAHNLGKVVCLPRAMFDDLGKRTLDNLSQEDMAQILERKVIVAGWISDLVEKLESGTP